MRRATMCFRKWIAAAIAASAAAMCFPHIAQAATISVNTTSDENNPQDGQCSLREAIDALNRQSNGDCTSGDGNADTITLGSGTFSIGVSLKPLHPVTLQGVGMTQTYISSANPAGLDIDPNTGLYDDPTGLQGSDCNSPASALYVGPNLANPGLIELFALTLQQAPGGSSIQGICAARGTVMLNGARVTNFQYGGIHFQDFWAQDGNTGGNLSVYNSSVTYNHSFDSGAGVLWYITQPNSLVIQGSAIQHNNGESWGGGLGIIGTLGGTVSITQSIISNNSTYFDGGGLAAVVPDDTDHHTLIMSRVLFYDNQSAGDGGGLYLSPCELFMDDSTIDENHAGVPGLGGGSGAAGGGISWTWGGGADFGNWIHNTITGNTAGPSGSGGVGGGLYLYNPGNAVFQYDLVATNAADQAPDISVAWASGSGSLGDAYDLIGNGAGTQETAFSNTTLVGASADLGTLGYYPATGATCSILLCPAVRPLLTGSQALGAIPWGADATGFPVDQRGASRAQGVAHDIGAYEH